MNTSSYIFSSILRRDRLNRIAPDIPTADGFKLLSCAWETRTSQPIYMLHELLQAQKDDLSFRTLNVFGISSRGVAGRVKRPVCYSATNEPYEPCYLGMGENVQARRHFINMLILTYTNVCNKTR